MEGGQRLQGEGRGNRVWVGLRPPLGIFQKIHLYLFVSEKYRIFAAVITKQREDGSNDDRSEEADFKDNEVGKGSQVYDL